MSEISGTAAPLRYEWLRRRRNVRPRCRPPGGHGLRVWPQHRTGIARAVRT